jgi:aryl-alcohol dehydrogenase-like predicted oxidoreductase
MRRVPLFSDGPQVSVVGLSLSAPPTASLPLPQLAVLAPDTEDPEHSGEARLADAIRAAIRAGVNLIDTDWITANGHAQEVLGRVLETADRDKLVISTKAGPRLAFKGELTIDNSRANLINQCHDSLFRLKTKYVDLLQVHWPDDTDPAQTARGLEDARHQGLARAAGVCNYYDIESIEALRAQTPLACVQAPLNVFNRRALKELLPWCKGRALGFLAADPLLSGLVAGRFTGAEEFSEADSDEWFSKPKFGQAVAAARELHEYAQAEGTTGAALAIAWCLHQPGVTSVLCPITDGVDEQVWKQAAELELSARHCQEIDGITGY